MTSARETPGRMLGVDYGERRIGIAVSEGRIAIPLAVIEHKNRAQDVARVLELAAAQEATKIVVGVPMTDAAAESEQARRARRFGEQLAEQAPVPVVFEDERISSVEAAALTAVGGGRRRGGRAIDDRAAAIILQRHIDAQVRAE